MASNATEMAHGFLTAFDASVSRMWREEDEAWHAQQQEFRAQDVDWMESEHAFWAKQLEHRFLKERWREQDMQQNNLENARGLWLRFVERNRRDVEEKSEQLKAVSSLAALFTGFAIVTLTQFQIQTNYSKVLVGVYGILTAIVAGLMIISMVTCTLILGSIMTVGKGYVDNHAEEEFMFDCKSFYQNYQVGDRPPCPVRTLEAFWVTRCESSWQLAFFSFSMGVSFFLVSLLIIGWITYSNQSKLTTGLFVSLCGIAIVLWLIIQLSWGAYFRKSRLVIGQGEPLGGHSGLPHDWYLAPNIHKIREQRP
ncbi:hypothetical protein O6H91_15G079300 [Diphasiastrum complanatum]|uniref:Uncharacterized protein n=1 Tax=Diphasiastrum complanatum TaxID=34168 RepID=A0ACC2BK66_DIPCM|nr:hypothetical protein O6H91_15G079300 [Diphasiastrum complanatum]